MTLAAAIIAYILIEAALWFFIVCSPTKDEKLSNKDMIFVEDALLLLLGTCKYPSKKLDEVTDCLEKIKKLNNR
jgi:hypothetical protein